VAIDGTYYCIDQPGNIWRYMNGVWNEINNGPATRTASCLACDPRDATHIVYIDGSGFPNETHNATAATPTWTYSGGQPQDKVTSGGQPAWLSVANDPWLTPGDIVFDPSGTLYFAQGTGVLTCTTITFGSNPPHTWYADTVGVENLCPNDICCPPGQPAILACEDRPFWQAGNTSAYGTYEGAEISYGASVDFALGTPSFSVGVCSTSQNGSPILMSNSNGGDPKSWVALPTQPSTSNSPGGCIAVLSTTQFVYNDLNASKVYVTGDGGKTWVQPASLPQGQFGGNFYLCRHVIAKDGVTPGTVYLFSAAGVYRSVDFGQNWNRVALDPTGGCANFNATLKSVPGQAGHLFLTPGSQGGPTGDHPATGNWGTFWRSTDGGKTWQSVSNVLEVWAFAIGAPSTPNGYPSILVNGWVNNKYSNWQSNDDAQSWQEIGLHPWIDEVKVAGGDMMKHGHWYLGCQGSGFREYVSS
jgi:hypothetical protein